jgi:hypothetical protein
MQFKFITSLDYFVFFIIFIKIVFVISALGHLILTHLSVDPRLDGKLLYWKDRTEFIFIVSMSILLIYSFRINHEKPINKETSILFYLFGWILLITAKWDIFIKEAPWYKVISQQLS